MPRLLGVSCLLALSGAARAVSAQAVAAKTYSNPVLAKDFPDPTVIRGDDGMFYVYGTMGNGCRIQVASSPDLVAWSWHGEALAKPSWMVAQNTWAPDVSFHDGLYYMYFAASGPDSGPPNGWPMCIGVATSKSPLGPFTDSRGSPLFCGDQAHTIDPKSFDDPVSGNTYLYFGSDFIPVSVVQLAKNRTSVADGAETISLIPMSTAPYESLVEGAWVEHVNGTYYLFYSGNNCCGQTANYSVMVAQSNSPTGPFIKLGPATNAPNNASMILVQNPGANNPGSTGFTAPGHCSVVHDDAGQAWIYYHAYAAGKQVGGPRMLMMDRLTYNGAAGPGLGLWPTIAGGVPSTSAQTAPVVN